MRRVTSARSHPRIPNDHLRSHRGSSSFFQVRPFFRPTHPPVAEKARGGGVWPPPCVEAWVSALMYKKV